MTTFDEREAAFESKYAHDTELQFRLEARADRKLAQWAAEKLGKSASEIDSYTAEVIRADLKESGPEDVIAKVTADLGASATAMDVREKYADFLAEAKAELTAS
ncbi:DUF1476 domain-containing protein [Celeribacter ethanolicus]|uniref:DUF1476 domain-containing protein n=1 Tax=Celeribacter ethanolicus TaxID=1758178 RepID=UPI000836C230|nr:DUF1476 domain-containing protein [Celeribacter ethanolicus]TNE64968.1 MAG: DUF1476 domain-containing protein [Paracoccaceae bacterium]